MKVQVILITLLFSLLSVHGYSANKGGGDQTENKKPSKAKYDFNLFKMYSIDSSQPISVDSTSLKSATPYKRKKD